MQEIIDFINRHPILIGLFVALLVAVVTYELRRAKGGAKKMSLTQATQLMNQDKTVVVDVRAKADFKQGHLLGAKNIPMADLKDNLQVISKDKSIPVLVYCQMGVTSLTASKQLMDAGFTDVYSLAGGVNAWQAENMPLEK